MMSVGHGDRDPPPQPPSDENDAVAVETFLSVARADVQRRIEAVLVNTRCTVDGWKWWDWFEYFSSEPSNSFLVLTVEDGDALWDAGDEISSALEATALFFETYQHGVGVISVDSWRYPDLNAAVSSLLQLRWIRRLVSPELASVHRTVFDWFRARPSDLSRLHWREFEELVASAFQDEGMTLELGTGANDGGIDIRLTRHEVFGDALTTMQIKSGRTPVRLHWVQALAAASQLEGASGAIFVATSRYLPGAKNWAKRWEETRGQTLTLAGPAEVQAWCEAAHNRTWFPNATLRDPTPTGSGSLIGKVMQATSHYRMITNSFGLVVRQTRRAILMRHLDTILVDGHVQRGSEIPDVAAPPDGKSTYIAARFTDDDREYYTSTAGSHFYEWDCTPQHFDLMD